MQLLPGATEDEINHLEKNIKAMPSVTTMLEEGKTVRDMLELALAFYSRLNQFDDAYLEAHNYSRQEIEEGLHAATKLFGIQLE